jgi:hypothetical protein
MEIISLEVADWFGREYRVLAESCYKYCIQQSIITASCPETVEFM